MKEEEVERQLAIEDIRVGGRFRSDLGDIEALAKSIVAVGLINAITVTPDGYLLAGQRRLEACRRLGWLNIRTNVVDNLNSASARLRLERDENTERKAMTPEELVRLGRALEELERPKAQARKEAGQFGSGHVTLTEATSENGRQTRDVVAEALGVSASTYERAKMVVDAARDTTLPAEDRAIAREALDEMNTTGLVAPAYRKVRKTRDPRVTTPRRTTVADLKTQRHAIGTAASTLTGISYGLKQIAELHPAITSEEAAQWVSDLSEARRVIEVLIKRLKERTNAQA